MALRWIQAFRMLFTKEFPPPCRSRQARIGLTNKIFSRFFCAVNVVNLMNQIIQTLVRRYVKYFIIIAPIRKQFCVLRRKQISICSLENSVLARQPNRSVWGRPGKEKAEKRTLSTKFICSISIAQRGLVIFGVVPPMSISAAKMILK